MIPTTLRTDYALSQVEHQLNVLALDFAEAVAAAESMQGGAEAVASIRSLTIIFAEQLEKLEAEMRADYVNQGEQR